MTDLDSLAAQLEELNAVQEVAQEPEESSPVKTRKKQKKEKPDEPKPEKKSRKAVIALILIIVLLLGLVGGVLWYFLVYNAKSPLEKESEALGGLLAGKTPAEQQDILNEKVKEGQVLLGIAAEPIFEYNGKKGRIGIENDKANNYSFQVTITEDATGDVLYESGVIDPGYYVEFIELNKTLAAGDYPATALFTTYSLSESPDPIAQIKANLKLHVTDGQFYQ